MTTTVVAVYGFAFLAVLCIGFCIGAVLGFFWAEMEAANDRELSNEG